jgi:hypothetical protein
MVRAFRTGVAASLAAIGLSACAGGGVVQDVPLASLVARNHAFVLARIESFHKNPANNQWIGGGARLSLTPSNLPPFFNDVILCPGRTDAAAACGLQYNILANGSETGKDWSTTNSTLMEVPAGTYSLSLLESRPYIIGDKEHAKSRLPSVTVKAGEVVNLGSIKAYFAQPPAAAQVASFKSRVSARFANDPDEAAARAFLAATSPGLANAMVTRLLPLPKD